MFDQSCFWRLHAILEDCTFSERAWLENQKDEPYYETNELKLAQGPKLGVPVRFKEGDAQIYGKPDFTVWNEEKSAGISLVVARDFWQCLAYLGRFPYIHIGEFGMLTITAMIQEYRKKKFNHDIITYGVVTDGYYFTFLRVDNERQVSHLSMFSIVL